MGFEVGLRWTFTDLYPQSRVVFSGVGIRRKRSKRSALRCIARRLRFLGKTVTCELESVELVGRVLGGVWEGLRVYVLRGVESQLLRI